MTVSTAQSIVTSVRTVPVTSITGHKWHHYTVCVLCTSLRTRLLPKVQADLVICTVPAEVLVDAGKKVLYTGNIGGGKIFIYDIENVIKVGTGEEGCKAL